MGKNEVDLIMLGSLIGSPAHEYEVKKEMALAFGWSLI
jgi:hypothetical protein